METEILWLGTQSAYSIYLESAKAILAKADVADPDQADLPWALEVQGSVGIINISGSLVDGSAGWGRYFGRTGYGDIREAVAAAVANPGISSILLNVASGGGHVAGVHETAQLLQRVNKIKPVVTYTGSTMASAALWLGVSGKKVFASQTAETGSIGILMMHADQSKQLEDAGIKITVIRAGTDKALATPYEPLSDKAKQNMQDRASALYDIFIKHVADARGTTVAAADKAYGQGRTFLGQQAKDLGLVDQVGTFEDAMAYAEKVGKKAEPAAKTQHFSGQGIRMMGTAGADLLSLDVINKDINTSIFPGPVYAGVYSSAITALEGKTNMPKSLSDEQLAAMAAGVDLNQAAEEPAAPAADTKPATEPEPTPAAQAPAVSAVDVVKEMLTQAQTDLVTVKAEVVTLKAQLSAKGTEIEAAKAETDKFVEIARASVKTMGLHFGLTAENVAALKPNEVLAEHTRLSDLFKAKFKAGGVAATTSESAKPKQAVPLVFAAMSNQAK